MIPTNQRAAQYQYFCLINVNDNHGITFGAGVHIGQDEGNLHFELALWNYSARPRTLTEGKAYDHTLWARHKHNCTTGEGWVTHKQGRADREPHIVRAIGRQLEPVYRRSASGRRVASDEQQLRDRFDRRR